MRWLLEWLVYGAAGDAQGHHGRLVQLRDAGGRLRRRIDYHRGCADAARAAFDASWRRVRRLEISTDAEVSDLVEAHHELLRSRNALDHHERGLEAARRLYGKMRADRRRLEEGRDPKHWAAYASELDG